MSMTIQQAIARIEDHVRVHHIGEPPHIHIGEALQMALDALRKREPAPVVKKLALDKIYLYFCPCCKKLLNAYFNSHTFCPYCGQALKWEVKKWE